MRNTGTWIRKDKNRKYIYGIALAALPIAVGMGIITETDVPNIVALVGAILVPSLAFVNTPTDKDIE